MKNKKFNHKRKSLLLLNKEAHHRGNNAGLKTQHFPKNVRASSSALLPLKNFAIFENPFLVENITKFHQILSSTSSLNICSQFASSMMPSLSEVVRQ